MDQIDKHILQTLQQNGRVPMTELGRIVGLSQPAVTERVRRLEEQSVITNYRAVVSPDKVGKQSTAYLLFHTKHCEEFIAFCRETPDVVEVNRISGEYNYLIKIVTDTMQTLESFINSSGKYGNSTTLIVMSTPIGSKDILPAID